MYQFQDQIENLLHSITIIGQETLNKSSVQKIKFRYAWWCTWFCSRPFDCGRFLKQPLHSEFLVYWTSPSHEWWHQESKGTKIFLVLLKAKYFFVLHSLGYFLGWCLSLPCSNQCFHWLTCEIPSIWACNLTELSLSKMREKIFLKKLLVIYYRFVVINFTYFRYREFEKDYQWSWIWNG